MSTGPPDALVGPGHQGPSVFALPPRTSFRFALLIAAVLASSTFIYQTIYLATPRGGAWQVLARRCMAAAMAHRPVGWIAYAAALTRAAQCRSGAEHVEALWTLLGVALLTVLAGVIYAAQPWWYRRRMGLRPLADQGPAAAVRAPGAQATAALLSRLEVLRQRAGTGPVTWLLQPLNVRLSAFAFGGFRRRFVAISGGAAVAVSRQPAAFDAVVLHELSHIKNRDIHQTYLAVAIWRSFVVAVLAPMAVLLIVSRELGSPPRLAWRVAVLALIVYLLRNSILRSREFDADARVRQIDPGTGLSQVLDGLPPRLGRRLWHLGWRHPSGADRAAALLDGGPLFRCGFWDGLAVGLVAAIGVNAAQQALPLVTTSTQVATLIPAAVFGIFCAGALTAALWRKQLLQPPAAAGPGWPVGLGLGLGLAVGPVISLSTALDNGIAPDTLRPGAFALLAGWIALVTLIVAPFPQWIGYWADAWQHPAGDGSRVPARAGLLVASAAAWVVLVLGLTVLLDGFILFQGVDTDAASTASVQGGSFWLVYVSEQPGAWAVGLVVVAVPLAAYLAGSRVRSPEDRAPAAPRLRPAARWAGLCLAGGLTSVMLTLAISGVAHARVAAPMRWNSAFLVNVVFFDVQAVVVVAAACALIAAVWARSVRALVLAVAVAAVVAALGVVAVINLGSIGSCIGALNLTYTHPPAGGCPSFVGGAFLGQQILYAATEAVLASIIFIPAARYAGARLARRWPRPSPSPAGLPPAARARRPRRAAIMLAALGTGAVVIAALAGAALWGSQAGTHDVAALSSIGSDGWIRGPGYQFRLCPSWYDAAQPGHPDGARVVYSVTGTVVYLASAPVNAAVEASTNAELLRQGGRAGQLDGTRGLEAILVLGGVRQNVWFGMHGPRWYLIEIPLSAYALGPADCGVVTMVRSWRWNAAG
jgi:Zn-dependent protease with chaperone function